MALFDGIQAWRMYGALHRVQVWFFDNHLTFCLLLINVFFYVFLLLLLKDGIKMLVSVLKWVLTNFPVIYFRNKGNKSYKISFFSISKHDSDTVRMQEMASNFFLILGVGACPQTPLESLRRSTVILLTGPKLLIKLANTTDSLHLG